MSVPLPDQRPQLIGKTDRYHFSLSETQTEGLHTRDEVDATVIQAGSISGVLAGNTYTIMKHGAETADAEEQLAEVHVIDTSSFKAVSNLKLSQPETTGLPDDGAVAFLKESVLSKWPVEIPPHIPRLEVMVQESLFVRLQEPENSGFALAILRLQLNAIVLLIKCGIEVTRVPVDASPNEQLSLRRAVEQLARAKHLLGLRNNTEEEYLYHKTRIEFGILGSKFSILRFIRNDGTDDIPEKVFTFIRLTNCGFETVYVTIFSINAVGKISQVSRMNGIELPPGRCETVLQRKNLPIGLPITWPKEVSRTGPLEETLSFIFTTSPVDLCHLAIPVQHPPPPEHRLGFSGLVQLAQCIASGCRRNANAVDDENILPYSTHRIVYSLIPETT